MKVEIVQGECAINILPISSYFFLLYAANHLICDISSNVETEKSPFFVAGRDSVTPASHHVLRLPRNTVYWRHDGQAGGVIPGFRLCARSRPDTAPDSEHAATRPPRTLPFGVDAHVG